MFVDNLVLIAFAISPVVSSAVRNLGSVSTCRASEFTCPDGTCIRAGAVCDTNWDCPDGSDEASCYSRTNSNLTEATVSHERYKRQSPCGIDQWRCTDGTCIAVNGKCDDKIDCPDRSDETHALCRNSNGKFRCLDGNAIPASEHCDGIANCPDGSDETVELCNRILPANLSALRAADTMTTMATVSGKCVLPPYPEHGTYVAINAPSATPGQRFEYAQLNVTCEQGYRVIGDAVSYCLDGIWFIPIQKCVQVCRLDPDVSVHYYCQIPGADGNRLCNQFEPLGTLVKPECNKPIYGSSDLLLSMTCQSNGKWNRVIKCKAECGRVTPEVEGLIWGGTEAVRGELPWHVAIYRKPTQKKKYYEQICGGSLVSNRIVISAAHCFWNINKEEKQAASNYAVATAKRFRKWDHTNDTDAQKSELKSIELSPYYQGVRTNFQHDVAVLILKTPFVYYTYVRPVCLDFEKDFNRRQLQLGNFGKVAGWGLTAGNGPSSPVLKVVQLPFVPIQECIRITPQTFTESITGDKICAGYNNGTAAVCKGDSGGGLSFPDIERNTSTTRYYLRGIVSTSPRRLTNEECNVFTVTTFTEVYQHKDFINQFMSTTCTLPPYPEHGFYEVAGDPAAEPGDDAEKVHLKVSCNHDHSVIGNSVVECIQGEWSTKMPECVPICYLQENPTVTYSCNRPGAEGFGPCGEYEPLGTFAKPKCGPGYYSPAVMPPMRCLYGTWDYEAQCTPECGRLSDNATSLPWYVMMYEEGKRICAGSIVRPNIVISAAHCVTIGNDEDFNVVKTPESFMVTKILDAINDEDKFPVKDLKITERFQGSTAKQQDDIVMVILTRAFTYSMKLHPVCLDFDYSLNKKHLQEGNSGTVGVFHFTGYDKKHPPLDIDRMPYIPTRKCLGINVDFRPSITGDKICAGWEQGTFSCGRNGGSGLAFPENQRGVVRYYLRGIVSSAPKAIRNCALTSFMAFTEVQKHRDFILEHLATSLPPRIVGWQETEDAEKPNNTVSDLGM